ncbi:Granaticin polyketide synthase putative ketoacyl reductase 2 [Verticillium dahliae VDG2]|nr:Granaticin polyketide synthase putative ketoacyl reductase 2 [Verticillium dahliae VDG2]
MCLDAVPFDIAYGLLHVLSTLSDEQSKQAMEQHTVSVPDKFEYYEDVFDYPPEDGFSVTRPMAAQSVRVKKHRSKGYLPACGFMTVFMALVLAVFGLGLLASGRVTFNVRVEDAEDTFPQLARRDFHATYSYAFPNTTVITSTAGAPEAYGSQTTSAVNTTVSNSTVSLTKTATVFATVSLDSTAGIQATSDALALTGPAASEAVTTTDTVVADDTVVETINGGTITRYRNATHTFTQYQTVTSGVTEAIVETILATETAEIVETVIGSTLTVIEHSMATLTVTVDAEESSVVAPEVTSTVMASEESSSLIPPPVTSTVTVSGGVSSAISSDVTTEVASSSVSSSLSTSSTSTTETTITVTPTVSLTTTVTVEAPTDVATIMATTTVVGGTTTIRVTRDHTVFTTLIPVQTEVPETCAAGQTVLITVTKVASPVPVETTTTVYPTTSVVTHTRHGIVTVTFLTTEVQTVVQTLSTEFEMTTSDVLAQPGTPIKASTTSSFSSEAPVTETQVLTLTETDIATHTVSIIESAVLTTKVSMFTTITVRIGTTTLHGGVVTVTVEPPSSAPSSPVAEDADVQTVTKTEYATEHLTAPTASDAAHETKTIYATATQELSVTVTNPIVVSAPITLYSTITHTALVTHTLQTTIDGTLIEHAATALETSTEVLTLTRTIGLNSTVLVTAGLSTHAPPPANETRSLHVSGFLPGPGANATASLAWPVEVSGGEKRADARASVFSLVLAFAALLCLF